MFQELGVEVVGISADGLAFHLAFAQGVGGLPFPLASDEDLHVSTLYGVLDESGKRSRRAVFVIDRDGTVLLALPWYNPANATQYAEIFEALGVALI